MLKALTLLLAVAVADPSAKADLQALIDAGHYKQARAIVEEQFKSRPNDPRVLYFLSKVKWAFGDHDAAQGLMEHALQLQSDNVQAHAWMAEIWGTKAQSAGFFGGMSLIGKFKDEVKLALALDPNNVDANEGMVHFHLGAPGIVGGDKTKAPEYAQRIMAVDKVRGYFMLATIAADKKDESQVEQNYRKAVEADPKSYRALNTLANYLIGKKRFEEAEKLGQAALALDPQRSSGYIVLAFIYASQQKWQALDEVLAKSEKALPGDLNSTYQAGRVVLVNATDLPRAERYFRKYLTQEPEGGAPTLAGAHWRLGLTLEKEGRKPEAVREVETATRLDPKLEAAAKDLKRMR